MPFNLATVETDGSFEVGQIAEIEDRLERNATRYGQKEATLVATG